MHINQITVIKHTYSDGSTINCLPFETKDGIVWVKIAAKEAKAMIQRGANYTNSKSTQSINQSNS